MKQKSMPFSEAILLGLPEIKFTNECYLRKQGTRAIRECAGCLVGAALYAVGVRDLGERYGRDMLAEHWPWTEAKVYRFDCPVCPKKFSSVVAHIATHLATHYQSKEISAERIADIFRKLEPRQRKRAKSKKEMLDRTPVGCNTGPAEAE